VHHELSNREIEAVVLERQMLGGGASDVDDRETRADRGDERFGRIDRR